MSNVDSAETENEWEMDLWLIPKWYNFFAWLRWIITGKPIRVKRREV